MIAVGGMLLAPTHQGKIRSAYDLGYFVGPTAHSLLAGKGLLVCSARMGDPGNTICFHSARMPLASVLVAVMLKLFGDHLSLVEFLKSFLFLVPLWLAMTLVVQRAERRQARLLCALILALPLLSTSLLLVMTSVEVEEGYLYSLVALALVLVLFQFERKLLWTLGLGGLLITIFLAKSSMLGVVMVVMLAGLLLGSTKGLRILLLVPVLLAPISWALYQHHASHRFSVGTSLDGLNFHKGNNPQFENRYPTSNARFDSFDAELGRGLVFQDEWTFSDYHLRAGRDFVLTHPYETFTNTGRKARYLLFSVDPYISTHMGRTAARLTTAGLLLFRLLLWTSFVLAVLSVAGRSPMSRFVGGTYLSFLLAYLAPYVIGFGFMRHAVVLAFPAAILCCAGVISRARPDQLAAWPARGSVR